MTLWVNFIRDHRGVIRSRNTRLPALGARGSISRAGFSFRDSMQAARVASMVHAMADREAARRRAR